MKKVILFLTIFSAYLFSQTSGGSRTGGTRSSGTSRQSLREQRSGERTEERQAYIQDFIVSIIGSMLKHPDPKVRMQALQTIISGIAGGETEGGRGQGQGIRSFFAVGQEGRGGTSGEYAGAGAGSFVPDLYTLLSDPDPEIRDVASVGLDVMFDTDATLMKYMNDPDPLVRKYATKIYSTKSIGSNIRDRGSREEYGITSQMLALRTFLVKLKYEKDEEVKKAIVDSIEYFIETGGQQRGQTQRAGWRTTGADVSIVKYLNDPNPEIRKNAAKIIGQLDFSQATLNILMEALKKETDDDVKSEINRAIDNLIRSERTGGVAGRQ